MPQLNEGETNVASITLSMMRAIICRVAVSMPGF